MSDERPHVLVWRSAVLNSALSSTVKLCLVTLAEWADADGSNCYPSIPSVAKKASLNEKSVRRSFDEAEEAGFIARSHKGTAQGWRRFLYVLRIPEGADSAPARQSEGVDSLSGPSKETCGLSVQDVRTLSPEGADTKSTDLAFTYPPPIPSAARPEDILWKHGRALLIASGMNSKAAGSLLGGLKKAVGVDRAAARVSKAFAEQAVDPESFLMAIAPTPNRGRLPRDARSLDDFESANDDALAFVGGAK